MNKHQKKYLYLLLSIFTFSLLFSISCSQNVPLVNQVDYSVVFTYKDSETLPDSRLSLFIQNGNDARRCDRIKVHSLLSDYVWNTKNIKNIAYGDINWSGNVNFTTPESEKIPSGRYEVTYVNADDKYDNYSFDLNYDDSIYEMKSDEVNSYMSDRGILNLAVYDSDHILIYFGEKTEDLSSGERILSMYDNACSFQDVWITNDKTVICIMPEKQI